MTNDMAAAFGGARDLDGHIQRLLCNDSVLLFNAATSPVSPASSCGSSNSGYQDSLFDDEIGEGTQSSCTSSPAFTSVSIDCEDQGRDALHNSPRGKISTFDMEDSTRMDAGERRPPKAKKGGKTARFADQVVTGVLVVIAIEVEEVPYTPEEDEFIMLSAKYEASTIPVWKTAVDKLLVRFADENMEFPAADVYDIARELEEMDVMVGTSAPALEMFAEQVWCQYWGKPCNFGDDSDEDEGDEEEEDDDDDSSDGDEEDSDDESESDGEGVAFGLFFRHSADAAAAAADDDDDDDEYGYSTAEGDDADFGDSPPPLPSSSHSDYTLPARALAVLAWHTHTFHVDTAKSTIERLTEALRMHLPDEEEEDADGDLVSEQSTTVDVGAASIHATKWMGDSFVYADVREETTLQALFPEMEALRVAPAPTPKADAAIFQGVPKPDPPADLHGSKVPVDPHPHACPFLRTEDGRPAFGRGTIPVGQPAAAG
ncbi:hypothetical protein OF83DRAFT_1087339 [Amylostereum chailletii]|nr:hypothetical protein OF83DRAFT_1087339 [Amylostereum chailletii]